MKRIVPPVSTARLRQLAKAVAAADWSEFSMRVPAEPDRDADLVLIDAADEIDRLRAENIQMAEQHIAQLANANGYWQERLQSLRVRAALYARMLTLSGGDLGKPRDFHCLARDLFDGINALPLVVNAESEREIEKRVRSLGAEAALNGAAWRTLGYVLGKFPELEGLIVNELLERSRMEQLL